MIGKGCRVRWKGRKGRVIERDVGRVAGSRTGREEEKDKGGMTEKGDRKG